MKIFRRILKITGIVLLSLVLVLAGIVFFLGDKIEAYVIGELNKQLAVKVSIKSHKVTLFETFPNISVKFTGVVIAESAPLAGKPFVEAEKVYFSFNLIDVLGGTYKISKIKVEQAVARVYIKDSLNNYSILKPDTAKRKKESSALDLKDIILVNTRIDFTDLAAHNKIDITAENLKASGNFTDTKFRIQADGNGTIGLMRFGNSEWLKGKPFVLNTSLNVNTDASSYFFEESKIQLGDAGFLLSGNITRPGRLYKLDLAAEGYETDIGMLLAILPQEYSGKVKEYTSEGQFYFKGKIKGEVGDAEQPLVDINFGIKNGTIINRSFGGNLTHVNLSASINNRNKVFTLSVNPFSAIMNKENISGRLLIRDFDNPYIDTKIKGSINLKDLEAFMGVKGLSLEGRSNIDLELAGLVSDMGSTATLLNTKFAGSIGIVNGSVKRAENPFDFSALNGSFQFTNHNITSSGFSGSTGGNSFKFTGSIDNLLPYLFSEGKKILLNGSLYMPRLSLDPFLNKDPRSGTDTAAFKFPDIIDLQLSTSFDVITVSKFKAEKVIADFSVSNKNLRISELSAHTMDGDVAVNGSVKQLSNGEFLARLSFDGKGLDITKLFYQCGNFSQQEITDQNLSGKLTTNFQMAAFLSNKLVIDLNRLYVFADILVENGQLKQYKPLEGLSKFASVDELRNVSFKTLQNQIEIKENTIIIPNMMVKNNVLDLQVAGTHTFDNYLDYSLKLKVSDLLATKYNWRSRRKPDEVEDLGKQGMVIYFSIKGKPDNLQYGITKISFKPKLNLAPPAVKEVIKEEKNELKQLLKEEFSRKPEDKQPAKPKEEKVEWDE